MTFRLSNESPVTIGSGRLLKQMPICRFCATLFQKTQAGDKRAETHQRFGPKMNLHQVICQALSKRDSSFFFPIGSSVFILNHFCEVIFTAIAGISNQCV